MRWAGVGVGRACCARKPCVKNSKQFVALIFLITRRQQVAVLHKGISR